MTTNEAVRVVRILVHHVTSPAKPIASFLSQFPEIDLAEFFNDTDSFIDDVLHDQIFAGLELLKKARNSYRR